MTADPNHLPNKGEPREKTLNIDKSKTEIPSSEASKVPKMEVTTDDKLTMNK